MKKVLTCGILLCWLLAGNAKAQQLDNSDSKFESYNVKRSDVGLHDWPQLGGTSLRNATPFGRKIPTTWDIDTGTNIKRSRLLETISADRGCRVRAVF